MSNNLRVILAKKRMKVSDLHRLTGVSKTTLQKMYYEQSDSFKSDTLFRICEALGITLNDLFDDVEKQNVISC
ncbi:helix-turn-helix domain-containing protein [Enterococcus cecorum]|uniref:helix-turn-helix domain-containing protein n=1 Tax=Enterococcus cecorum TaxID=44008 RepID=UPI00148D7A05|nr:helix-turn-helix transcriptional regulator [Enterococcus cecorum]